MKYNIIRKAKPITAVFCIGLLMLVSCTGKKADSPQIQENQPVTIAATFYPLYIMLMNITEDVPGVKISVMAPPDTGCLHDYQMTPRDMLLIEQASVVAANGAGMEDFADKILAERKGAVIYAAQGAPLEDGNPHLWVSLEGAIYEVGKITEGLAAHDPERASLYQKNAQAYTERLSSLRDTMTAELAPFRGSNIVTFHEAFPYFAREFGFNIVGVIEREPGTAPTAKELLDVIALIRDIQERNGAIALFAEPQYSSSAAEIIGKETGLPVYELDPGVTGPKARNAYIDGMEKNMQVLKTALAAAE